MLPGPTRIRRRIEPTHRAGSSIFTLGRYENYSSSQKKWINSGGPVVVSHASFPSYREGQYTLDELHEGPPYKSGGPFDSIKVSSCEPPYGKAYGVGTYYKENGLRRYIGGFMPPFNSDFGTGMSMNSFDTYMDGDEANFPEFGDMGDQAYNRTKPKLEKAGGGVFLAELRDLPRMMRVASENFHDLWKGLHGDITSKTMRPKKIADTFLNHHFGWVPFISDIGKFYNAFERADQHIDKLTRENGQWIRRAVTLEQNLEGQVLQSGYGVNLFPNSSFDSPFDPWFNPGLLPTWSLSEIVETKIWAVGRYRYYRPEFDKTKPDHMSRINDLKRQISLYGLRISPSNIYKATPWTWAIDWVSNLGDQIDHANDVLVDSIANQYLYVMQRRIIKRRFTQTIPFVSGHVTMNFDRIIETKQRRAGSSPYGFSLSLANLTPRQVAIAGALGVSGGFRR